MTVHPPKVVFDWSENFTVKLGIHRLSSEFKEKIGNYKFMWFKFVRSFRLETFRTFMLYISMYAFIVHRWSLGKREIPKNSEKKSATKITYMYDETDTYSCCQNAAPKAKVCNCCNQSDAHRHLKHDSPY